jgi:hypothetical protein
MSFIRLVEYSNLDHLHSKYECLRYLTLFRYPVIPQLRTLLKFWVMWSVSLINCSVMLCFAWNPNWLAMRKFFPSMCLWTIFRTTFSKSLSVTDNRLIGHKYCVNVWSLPGFSKAIIFAPSKDVRKCESQMQWLIKCRIGTGGELL